jgi:hypothetical protein
MRCLAFLWSCIRTRITIRPNAKGLAVAVGDKCNICGYFCHDVGDSTIF